MRVPTFAGASAGKRVPFTAAVATAAIVAVTACSRQPAPAPPANQSPHDAHGAAASAAAKPRTALLGNLGSYHRAIKTANADAQQFFDEGLTLLYGFNHEESFKSFEIAAAKDAASPMPHWGMSLALGTNINDVASADRLKQAYAHLAEAEKRKGGGSDVEQGLVEALAKRYVADPTGDQADRERAYSDAMGALSKKFPDDLDVATLYAESLMNLRPWRLYTKDGTPEPGTDTIVASLEGVMRRDPNHPGANHYYIHAVEASKTPNRALPQAGRLETLVPGAGHLVHMPAHIYIRTGDYAKSAKSNADAAAVDEKYFKATGAKDGLYPMMYYTHNLQFESAAAMFAGNLAQARSAAERTVKFADPIADQMMMVEPFAAQDLSVLVRFGQWPEILKAKAPAASRLLQTSVYHFAHGAALAATGKIAEAEADLAALRAAAAKIKKDEMIGSSNTVVDVTAVAIADLGARIADAKGDTAAAIKGFTAAIAAEDKLGYNEPPDWLNPGRERLGAILLKAGRFAEAEKVFRADLEKNAGNPRSLYGLYRAWEGQKKTGTHEYFDTKAGFDKAWAGADVTLTDDLYGSRR
jgi:tetratricopeptide (TPR) repeat protein